MTAYADALDRYYRGNLVAALPLFQQALRDEPQDVNVMYHCMLTLVAMRKYEDCAYWLQQLIPHVNPVETPAWMMGGFYYNLGVSYEASGQWAAAERCHRNALAFEPDAVQPKICIGSNCYRQGKPDEARKWHDEVLAVEPIPEDSKPSRALIRLGRGDYAGGFAEYEARWKMPQVLAHSYIPKGAWRWKGKPLDGKKILVASEQGIGDSLMMARYIPMIQERGGKVVVIAAKVLHRLLLSSFPGIECYEKSQHPQCQWWAPMMSLPYVFGTTLDTIPLAPYLKAPDAPPLFHSAQPNTIRRIGYCTNGNPLFMADKDRSAPPGAFRPLLDLPNIAWVDLSEAADKARGFTDIQDTASLVKQLDLVITVDTAICHLSGGLGVPTWMLPITSSAWFCGTPDQPSTAWYQGIHRMYWRKTTDDWAECVERVKSDLNQLVEK